MKKNFPLEPIKIDRKKWLGTHLRTPLVMGDDMSVEFPSKESVEYWGNQLIKEKIIRGLKGGEK